MTFGPITIVRPGANAQIGIVGPQGRQGLPGQDGAPGAIGPATLSPIAVWQSGRTYLVGPPASYVSTPDGSYACVSNHTSGTFAADLANGCWIPVALRGGVGPAGTPGSTWFSGTGIPDPSIGANGDYYFRRDTADIYIKVSGAWGSPIANLTGPAGPGTGNVNGPAGAITPGNLAVWGADQTHIVDGGTPGTAATRNVGTTAGTVAAGDALATEVATRSAQSAYLLCLSM